MMEKEERGERKGGGEGKGTERGANRSTRRGGNREPVKERKRKPSSQYLEIVRMFCLYAQRPGQSGPRLGRGNKARRGWRAGAKRKRMQETVRGKTMLWRR